jgi:predicted  nucleic acid-binding Zn-ribbon protein
MSKNPSHILIRFTIIGFLTLAGQDAFLSAAIRTKEESAAIKRKKLPPTPIISQPEQTEIFPWQQNVAHDTWGKIAPQKGWFGKQKSLDQKEINKIIQRHNPYKEANKEPVQPKKKKAGLIEKIANWQKQKKQLNDEEEALITFIEAQRLTGKKEDIDAQLQEKIKHFMDCFSRLDEQHKLALTAELQKSLDQDLKRKKEIKTLVPYCKNFIDELKTKFAPAVTTLEQTRHKAGILKEQAESAAKTIAEIERTSQQLNASLIKLAAKIEPIEKRIKATKELIQGSVTNLLHGWQQPQSKKDYLIAIAIDPYFSALLEKIGNEDYQEKWNSIKNDQALNKLFTEYNELLTEYNKLLTEHNKLYAEYKVQLKQIEPYQKHVEKLNERWLTISYEVQTREQWLAQKPIYAAIKKLVETCDNLMQEAKLSPMLAPKEEEEESTTQEGATMTKKSSWKPITEEEPSEEEKQAQKKYEKFYEGFTYTNPNLPFSPTK